MTIQSVDNIRERRLVTLILMDDDFCKQICPLVNHKELKTPYAYHVVQWIKEYFENYGDAPKDAIYDIWETKKKHLNDPELSSSISVFLTSVKDNYNPSDYQNKKAFIDECIEYMREVHLEKFVEGLKNKIDGGKYEEAEALVSNFRRTGASNVSGISIISDIDAYEQAFSDVSLEPLFTFEGHLKSITPPLFRGDFFAILSTAKAGKSFALQHVAHCALSAGCNVLSINLEMRENEFLQRYWRGVHMSPIISGNYDIPVFEPDVEPGVNPKDATAWRFNHKTIYREAISFSNKEKLREEMQMRYRGGDIVQITLPAYSTTVADIEAVLDNMEYFNNRVFDVICVDYADLLGSNEREYRHKLNDIWLNLRRIAQERNVCIATVSQSNGEGLEGKEISLSAIAEDKRKITHVTSLMGMWGSDEDRQMGLVRMKNLVSRYKTDTFGTVLVAQCLDLGQFHLDSKLETMVSGIGR